MEKWKSYLLLFIGSTILSFGIYNVHAQCAISEGGELGLELLLLHWFSISPAITALVMDVTFYTIGFFVLGKNFLKYSLFSTLVYSFTYAIFQTHSPLLPNLSNHLLLAAILGSLFVGIGTGIVISVGGACASDDTLAMLLHHKTKVPISICYLASDLTILLISLSYIPFSEIFYSIITVVLSSIIIENVQKILKPIL